MSIANINKHNEQMQALTNWRDNNFRGTAFCVTGFGKTRLGVLAAGTFCARDKAVRCIVLVPTTNLKDQWRDEFIKWGFKEILNQVEIVCYQSAYKYTDQKYDIIIGDEIHVGLSLEYRKVFENNPISKILCLTATIDDQDKKNFLDTIAPIIYRMDIARALELGLVSDYVMYNLAVPFTPEEQLEYNKVNMSYRHYERVLGGKFTAFSSASQILKNTNQYDKEFVVAATMFYNCMRKRKDLCYNSSNKITVAAQLLEKFSSEYSIVFSESIAPIEELHKLIEDSSVCFHSKMSKAARAAAMKKFKDKRTRIKQILTAKALNAGFNLESASFGMSISGTGKSLTRIQQLGRILRFKEGKRAVFVNLYTANTQEEKWIKDGTSTFSVEWINSIEQVIKPD